MAVLLFACGSEFVFFFNLWGQPHCIAASMSQLCVDLVTYVPVYTCIQHLLVDKVPRPV